MGIKIQIRKGKMVITEGRVRKIKISKSGRTFKCR